MKSLVIEATYENGVLGPATPLPLKEPAKVLVTVQLQPEQRVVTSEEAERIVRRSQGMLRWLDRRVEVLHRIADDPEFDQWGGADAGRVTTEATNHGESG